MQLEHRDFGKLSTSTSEILVQTAKYVKYLWQQSKGKRDLVPLPRGF